MEVKGISRRLKIVLRILGVGWLIFVAHLFFSGESRGPEFGLTLRDELRQLPVRDGDTLEHSPGVRPNARNSKQSVKRISSDKDIADAVSFYQSSLELNGWRRLSQRDDVQFFCKNDLSIKMRAYSSNEKQWIEFRAIWQNNAYFKSGCPGVQSSEWREKVIGQD